MSLLEPITPPDMWKDFLVTGDLDFAYEVPGLARFRVNLFKQERGLGAVFRVIPSKILTLEQLRMPKAVHKLVDFTSGLVLVTGPTGSGKSTTLAAIINEMNATRPMHFVTIEDPIEFVHKNQQSLVSQREVHKHGWFRQVPAVPFGQIRSDGRRNGDLETISMALSAAETDCYVWNTAYQFSGRDMIASSMFSSDQQNGIRGILASVIKCVISQQLLRRKKGGRVAALEILFAHAGISSLIRQDKTHQLPGAIQQGVRYGMVGMDASLRKLVEEDVIEVDAALEKSLDKDLMREWLKERGHEVPEEIEGIDDLTQQVPSNAE